MESAPSYSTFIAFKPHFDALARVGYYKLLNKTSLTKRMLHNLYRGFIWLVVLSYNLQHVINVVQTRHNADRMVDTLYILLTTLNTISKQVSFNLRVGRIDRIIKVINGYHFAPKNTIQVEILKKNERAMAKLLSTLQIMVITACIFAAVCPWVQKAMGQEVYLNAYFPFEIKPPAFKIVSLYLSFNLTLQAWGNSSMDCTIVAFYSMAKTQLRLLRYNLEHLVDSDGENEDNLCEKHAPYKDSKKIQKRFEHCVKHHRQILWFVKEVESIFCEAMAIQFLIMAWVICMTMYKIVGTTEVTAELAVLLIYLNCMLSQLFIYCYFGSQVKVESEFVAQSVYCGEWTQLSPSFRKQLLVLMKCSSRPIMPCAAKIVPISLDTYIAVLRASYTLFTILDKNEK